MFIKVCKGVIESKYGNNTLIQKNILSIYVESLYHIRYLFAEFSI